MTPDSVALTRPLDRITARIRVVEAEQQARDSDEIAALALGSPGASTEDLYRLELELRNACLDAQSAYHDALCRSDFAAATDAFHDLLAKVRASARELSAVQTQAVREARLRVELYRERVRARR